MKIPEIVEKLNKYTFIFEMTGSPPEFLEVLKAAVEALSIAWVREEMSNALSNLLQKEFTDEE